MKVLHVKVKAIILAITFFTLSSFLFTACNSKEMIKIGFVAALTGNSSETSVDGRNSVVLAAEEINKTGGIRGKQIQLLVVDDKNDKDIALIVDKYLVEQGAKVIIGHMTSGMAQLTVPFVNEENILMISPTISLDSLSGIDDNFLRVIPSNKLQGEFLADAAFKRKNVKKVAVIYDNRNKAFAEGVKGFFEQRIESYGGEIVATEIFDTGNNVNYSTIAQRIGKTDAEGVLVIASSVDAALFCQHFFKNDIRLPVFLPTWSMTNDFIKQGGPTVEGAYLVNFIDVESKAVDYVQFKKNYYEKYGSEPTFASLLSYEAAIVLFEAMGSTKELTAVNIKETILKQRRFKGLQDEIVIDEYGDITRKCYLYMVKNGVYTKVAE